MGLDELLKFSSICMLLSEPRCYLFSQNAGETCGKDQSTVQLEVERLEDSGQLVIHCLRI